MNFISNIPNQFSLKDLEHLSYFLGVKVLPHPTRLFLSQEKYILNILCRANMDATKPVLTPLATRPPLRLASTYLRDLMEYHALNGIL